MKGYQLEGVAWITSKFHNGVNVVLADEMGLGKTLQVRGSTDADLVPPRWRIRLHATMTWPFGDKSWKHWEAHGGCRNQSDAPLRGHTLPL